MNRIEYGVASHLRERDTQEGNDVTEAVNNFLVIYGDYCYLESFEDLIAKASETAVKFVK